jgi:phosphoribosyl-dephospho-CoA transferase
MNSHSRPANPAIRRHDLAFVSVAGWRSLLKKHEDLAANPLVARWVENGWPLVRRRAAPGDGEGAPLGLPLPPVAGKRRLAIVMDAEAIVSVAPPPILRSARDAAPAAWHATLDAIDRLATRHDVEARVFGSLAWQALTGLDYLTDQSDLDLLLYPRREAGLRTLTESLAAIEERAPMRLDGELAFGGGWAVNWRELYAESREILVKTTDDVYLVERASFLGRAR